MVVSCNTTSVFLSFIRLPALGWMQAPFWFSSFVRQIACTRTRYTPAVWGLRCQLLLLSLQAHTLLAFRHICSPWLLHHGNSAIPEGFCCGRPSLCGLYRTKHLPLIANQESILSCRDAACLCCYLRKPIFHFVVPAQPGEAEGPRRCPAFIGSWPHQCHTLLWALLPSHRFQTFLSFGCVDGPSLCSTSSSDGGDFSCWDPLQVNRTFIPPLFTLMAEKMEETWTHKCVSPLSRRL